MKEKRKNENKNFLKECLIILFVGIIVNAACFLMCSITGHCANEDQNYFPFQSGDNPSNLTVNQDFVNSLFENGAVFVHAYVDNRDSSRTIYSCITDIELSNSDPIYLYAELSSLNLYQFSLQFDGNPLSYKAKFYRDYNDGTTPTLMSTDNNTLAQFSALYSPYYSTYKHVYWCKYNINRNGANNSNEPVIYLPGENINPGEFVDLPGLDQILDNISNSYQPPSTITGHALPSQPTENPNNNDFQNRLQMFDYLKDVLTALFGNLGYNLSNWLNSLGSKIVQGFNSVSQNIWNGFNTLMSNIRDFFGPKIDAIIDKFNYITEEFSTEELATNLNNADFSSDFLGLITTVSTFSTALTSGTEPNSCSFTLDFTNSYYNFGVCEFSLDWILPFRSLIRLIIGCLAIYSLIISILTSLNTYIGGTSSINDDI